MLDKAATIVTDTLEHAHTLKVRLEREIAEKQELLRQANIVIEVFSPNLIRLEERVDPPVTITSRAKRTKPQLAAAE
nr:MAG TPA: Inner kinetochore subunit IML3, Inner kinetochore, DNA, nucleosome, DNA.15A [Caudoviricetes sp.]